MLLGELYKCFEEDWFVDSKNVLHRGNSIVLQAYNVKIRKQAILKCIPKSYLNRVLKIPVKAWMDILANMKSPAFVKVIDLSQSADCIFILCELQTPIRDLLQRNCFQEIDKLRLVGMILSCVKEALLRHMDIQKVGLDNIYLSKDSKSLLLNVTSTVGRQRSGIIESLRCTLQEFVGKDKNRTIDAVINLLQRDSKKQALGVVIDALWIVDQALKPEVNEQPKLETDILRKDIQAEIDLFISDSLPAHLEDYLAQHNLTIQRFTQIFIEILFCICIPAVKKKLQRQAQESGINLMQSSGQISSSQKQIRISIRQKIPAQIRADIERLTEYSLLSSEGANQAARHGAVQLAKKWYLRWINKTKQTKKHLKNVYRLFTQYEKQI